jgi:hypothetical protein
MHAAGSVDRWRARNQRVLEPLMIPFPMVVIDEFRHGPAEVALPKRNHPIETFLFDRSHEALRIGIRGLERCLQDVEAGLIRQPSHLPTPLPIPIADQHAVAAQQPDLSGRQRATDLLHKEIVGMRRRAEDLHTA